MIPENVLTSVRPAFDAYYQARSEELAREISIAENQMALDGLGRSGGALGRFREIYRDALRDCMSSLLESFERTLKSYDVRPESGFAQPMVDVIHGCLQPIASDLNQRLTRSANNAGVPLPRNLDDEVARLRTSSMVEINLLLGRLKSEWEARQRSRTDETRDERILRRLKDHPSVAACVLIGVIVIALGKFTDSVDKLWSFVEKRIPGSAPMPAEIPRLPTDSEEKASSGPQSSATSSSAKTTVADFSRVDTRTAPGHIVAAGPYLHDFGISVADLKPEGTKVVLINNLAVYQGDAVRPTTSQNFLTQVDTTNAPASFTLVFSEPIDSLIFTRPALYPATDSGITHPAWSAHALDAAGRELSLQSEGITRSFENVPAQRYTLRRPGFDRIAAVRFDSDPRLEGKPFAAFSAILIEQLTLLRESAGQARK